MDRFLSATYSASRRELATIKLAQQLSGLPTQMLSSMAGGSQVPAATGMPAGPVPTTGPSSPPQQGAPPALGMETPTKMAAAKEKMAAALQAEFEKRALQFGNAAKAVNFGQLLRHNAVPLATAAGGAAAGIGAGLSGEDGGVGKAIGYGALGGLGGFAAGKGGQLLHRASKIQGVANKGLAEGAKGMGFGDALKKSWNTEVTRNAQGLGFRGQAARPEGLMFKPPTQAATAATAAPGAVQTAAPAAEAAGTVQAAPQQGAKLTKNQRRNQARVARRQRNAPAGETPQTAPAAAAPAAATPAAAAAGSGDDAAYQAWLQRNAAG